MATRIWESAVLPSGIDAAWSAIRPMNFAWNPNVAGAAVEDGKSASEVGAVVKVTYKDKTVQRVRIAEISDATHSISWEMVESQPAVPIMSVIHTIKLRRVTENNTTFIEWITDFSKDADNNVLADARFKQKENFQALSHAVTGGKTGGHGGGEGKEGKKLIGLVYDPAKAKAGVQEIWTTLQELHKASGNALSKEAMADARKKYNTLPTFVPNWKLIDVKEEVAHKMGEEVRERLNTLSAKQGNNALPLPKLFQSA